jgi:hypothetical protein
MSRKKLLSILVIALIMPACDIRVSSVVSSSASVTNTPAAAIIATSI